MATQQVGARRLKTRATAEFILLSCYYVNLKLVAIIIGEQNLPEYFFTCSNMNQLS